MTHDWLRNHCRACRLVFLLALYICPTLTGCGGSSTSTPVQPGAGFKIDKVDVAKLPAVGDPLPPLDGGRLEIAMPANWKVGSRLKDRLAWSYMKTGQSYPQIFVSAVDADDIETLTPQDLQEFERLVQQELEAEEGIRLVGKVQAVQVGDFLGVQYIRRAKGDKGKEIDRLILETTHGKRRYQIEMRALVGTTLESRPIVLSVAGSAKFLNASAEPASE